MKNFIPLSVPVVQGNELKYVQECLETGWVSTAGKYVNTFENRISDYTNSSHSIACMNGTSAIHISLILSGVEFGDEIIAPSLTFIAPINTIKYLGAEPIFMDSDADFNIDIEKTIKFIKEETHIKEEDDILYCLNNKTGKKIKAIIVVHVFGNAIYLDELKKICDEKNIKIIEDASESLGSTFAQGKYAGAHTGTVGDFGCLSFNGNKIITCGSGGVILTQDKVLAEKAKYLTTQAKDDQERFIHGAVGYNYRMSNVQAAIGCAQLETLEDRVKKKHYIHDFYEDNLLENDRFDIHSSPIHSQSNYWLILLKIKGDHLDALSLMHKFKEAQIETRPVWHLNHKQKPYLNSQTYLIDNAQKLVDSSLCLPSSIDLTQQDMKRVLEVLNG